MAHKNDKDKFFRNLEEIDEEDSDTDRLNVEKDDVDRTISFFARVLHSTPVKARPNPLAVKNNPNRSLSHHLSHSEGDLSTSIGNLDISFDDKDVRVSVSMMTDITMIRVSMCEDENNKENEEDNANEQVEEWQIAADENSKDEAKSPPPPELLWRRKMTYTTIKSSPFINQDGFRSLVKMPNVIVMVGLPARGKTFISRKLCRYLNWIGIRTKAFNLGDYRRLVYPYETSDIFEPGNEIGENIRNECAQRALADMCSFLQSKGGEVAIFDATNTTRGRRRMVLDACTKVHWFRVFFVESLCDDPKIVEANIHDVKVNSPDYQNMDKELARQDFLKRIEHYQAQYEPMDDSLEGEISYIKVINAGRSFYVHNVAGHVQSRVVYFLMNIHLLPRSIYLTRHGESQYNKMGRIGGDSPLSEMGARYAEQLAEYFKAEEVKDLRIWSSQKVRAVQVSTKLKHLASYVEYWKALDEIDAGVCEGLTYEEIAMRYPQQFDSRDSDKYHYRYPSGESYEDLVGRLEPVIMELERQANVLVVSHQAVLRCILAYFLDKKSEECPYLRVPLHSVIKLTPIAYGCKMEMVKFDVEAVDTHRTKPMWSVKEQQNKEVALCHSP